MQVQLYKYDDEEYESLIKADSGDWTREETDFLFELLDRFDLRWPVITDRFEVCSHACMHVCIRRPACARLADPCRPASRSYAAWPV